MKARSHPRFGAVGLALMLVLTAGCTPEINKTEGFYACTDGGGCPSGTTCRRDGRCRAGSAVAGQPCDEAAADGPFCVNGLSCLDGTGGYDELDENSFCGTLCPDGDECADGQQCIGEQCLIQCEDEGDCETGDCRRPQFPMNAESLEAPICANLDERIYNGRSACMLGDMSCPPPGFCLTADEGGALCALRCETNDNCGMGGRCLLIGGPADAGQCFAPCEEDGDCGTGGFTCEETGLPGPSGEGTVCMPTAWAGQLDALTFDLGPPTMMMMGG